MINQPCDLPAGSYKCKVTDSGGNVEEFFYSIQQPDSISISVSTVNDNGSCNGSIGASFSGGHPPYQTSWLYNGDTITNLTGLCHGSYTASVTDSNSCNRSFVVTVNVATGLSKFNTGNRIKIFPNPANESIIVSSNFSDSEPLTATVYDHTGREIISSALPRTRRLDISGLQDGAYFVRVGSSYQKFIKISR